MRCTNVLTSLCLLPFMLASPLSLDPRVERVAARSVNRTSYCPSTPASEVYQRHIFASFVDTLYGEKNVTKAFDTFIAVNLIEHDPFDAQGRAANAAKLSAIIPYASFEVLRSSFDNNIGFIHVKVDESPEPIALADIYRMDGTCIVEHWDVTQARPANATNPIAMF
ncbi:hypothetical protein MMC13_006138 [Lambiella insularis]|nr:hypothetical protein [Lambiella insularis]